MIWVVARAQLWRLVVVVAVVVKVVMVAVVVVWSQQGSTHDP